MDEAEWAEEERRRIAAWHAQEDQDEDVPWMGAFGGAEFSEEEDWWGDIPSYEPEPQPQALALPVVPELPVAQSQPQNPTRKRLRREFPSMKDKKEPPNTPSTRSTTGSATSSPDATSSSTPSEQANAGLSNTSPPPTSQKDASAQWGANLTKEAKRLHMDRCRDDWVAKFIAEKNNIQGYWLKSHGHAFKRKEARNAWNKIDIKTREAMAMGYEYQPRESGRPPASSKRSDLRCGNGHNPGWKGVQLTWNMPVMIKLPDLIKLAKELVTINPHDPRFLEITEEIAALGMVKADFWHKMRIIKSKCDAIEGITEMTIAQELSILADEAGRIHYHAHLSCLRSKGWVDDVSWDFWEVCNCKPHIEVAQGRGLKCFHANNRGHAYLQVPKLGHLRHYTNWKMHEDFMVEQRWIHNWRRQRKFDHSTAKDQILEARGNSRHFIEEIEWVEDQLCTRLARKEMQIIRAMQAANFSRFKTYKKIEMFMAQFDPKTKGKKTRFKFLVMEGLTRMGKSQLAMNLFGYKYTLVVQCQGSNEPNLKEFRYGYHRAILMDEASWPLVVNNKLLFQCSAEGVTLAQSKCLQHAYWRCLFGVPLILCTNEWIPKESLTEEARAERGDESGEEEIAQDWVQQLRPRHINWINGNSYYLWIGQPVWDAPNAEPEERELNWG